MPSASQPAPAQRDRAERHVFALLPELPAVERRVLALLELTDAGRAATAADTGLDDTALRFAAKRARKALRRGSAPLSAGARCERAELLLSDRLDAPLPRQERKWLEIHQARCPRCTEHETRLATAREQLRASFFAEPPPALPPVLATTEPRAHLRVVPEPEAVIQETVVTERFPDTTVAETPAPERPRREVSPAVRRAIRWFAALVILAALIAGAIATAGAIDGKDSTQRAPWSEPSAPEVRPAPLSDQ